MRPITDVAQELGLAPEHLIPYGRHFAKVPLPPPGVKAQGKLILVTGITPTAHGEGKTVTTIGLAQSLRSLGHKAVATVRQPSMGPVFGLKGGATGGGLAQVLPAEPINLHFTGDFHAITAAHNLLSALIDAHIFHGNQLEIDPAEILWPRTLDVNDRALRRLTVCEGKNNGEPHPGQFVITAASEVMAIFALASSYDDLRQRLSNIVVAFNRQGQLVRARDLQAVGAMLVILRDAFQPNLAQTADGTPVLIHAGPFANIAHGTASVVAQRLALAHADYAVNEAGFGADLGAEKFFDIVMPSSGLTPAAVVVVATVRALAAQGEGNLQAGLANLGRHLDIVKSFGAPAVVSLNRFPQDTDADLAAIRAFCQQRGIAAELSEVFAKGAPGGLALAQSVVNAATSQAAKPQSLYTRELPLAQKLDTIAKKVYGADGFEFTGSAQAKADRLAALGFGQLPVCIAKTPMSFTADPKRLGAPTGWTLPISDLTLSAGAGFIVAIAGTTMRMPGLGQQPQALKMDLGPNGELIGVC